jgi:hypothetical protein
MTYKSFDHPSSQKIWFIAKILASYLVYGQKICVYFISFTNHPSVFYYWLHLQNRTFIYGDLKLLFTTFLATETIQSHLIFQIFISLSGEIFLVGKSLSPLPLEPFFFFLNF